MTILFTSLQIVAYNQTFYPFLDKLRSGQKPHLQLFSHLGYQFIMMQRFMRIHNSHHHILNKMPTVFFHLMNRITCVKQQNKKGEIFHPSTSFCQHWLIVLFCVIFFLETMQLYTNYTGMCNIKILAGNVKIFHIIINFYLNIFIQV